MLSYFFLMIFHILKSYAWNELSVEETIHKGSGLVSIEALWNFEESWQRQWRDDDEFISGKGKKSGEKKKERERDQVIFLSQWRKDLLFDKSMGTFFWALKFRLLFVTLPVANLLFDFFSKIPNSCVFITLTMRVLMIDFVITFTQPGIRVTGSGRQPLA